MGEGPWRPAADSFGALIRVIDPWMNADGRCVGDLDGLDLPPEVLDAYAYGDAQRVFFGA